MLSDFTQIQETLETKKPQLRDLGVEVEVFAHSKNVLSLRLHGVTRETDYSSAEEQVTAMLTPVVSGLTVLFVDPARPAKVRQEPPDENKSVCVLHLDRVLGGSDARVYDVPPPGVPLIGAILAVPQVVSVVTKENMIVVSRQGSDPWPGILSAVEAAIDGFDARAPAAPDEQTVNEGELWDRVWQVLDEQINPAISGHGGRIELLKVEGSTIHLVMGGGCQGCGLAAVTMSESVETAIREAIPEVGQIIDVTEHNLGAKPYFGN